MSSAGRSARGRDVDGATVAAQARPAELQRDGVRDVEAPRLDRLARGAEHRRAPPDAGGAPLAGVGRAAALDAVAGGDGGDGPAVAEDHRAAGGQAIEAGRQPRRGAALRGVGEVGADARQRAERRRSELNRQLEHDLPHQRSRRAHEHEARQPGRLDGHFDAGPDRDRALADDGPEIVGPDRVPGVDADLHRPSESPARGRARAASRPRRARSRRAPGRRRHR